MQTGGRPGIRCHAHARRVGRGPVQQIRALTGGRGGDDAFEAIGAPAPMGRADDTLARRGMAVLTGVTPMTIEVSVPVMSLVSEERVLTGSVYGSTRPRIGIPRLIGLYRAGLELDERPTHVPVRADHPGYEAPERARWRGAGSRSDPRDVRPGSAARCPHPRPQYPRRSSGEGPVQVGQRLVPQPPDAHWRDLEVPGNLSRGQALIVQQVHHLP